MTSIKQDGPLAERLRQCPLLAQSGHLNSAVQPKCSITRELITSTQ
jgi:hypothetical protein